MIGEKKQVRMRLATHLRNQIWNFGGTIDISGVGSAKSPRIPVPKATIVAKPEKKTIEGDGGVFAKNAMSAGNEGGGGEDGGLTYER